MGKENELRGMMETFQVSHPQKTIKVKEACWKYTAEGKKGNNLLWLTGGMRKAETGFSILPLFENEFFVIAPDYPPLRTMSEMVEGLASLLDKEGIEKTNVLGQSYGGLVAQGFLCRYPEYVEKLVLSSTAPLHGSLMKPWQLWLALLIAQTLPDKFMRRLFLKRLSPLLTVKEEERDFWQTYLEDLVIKRRERKDLLSHFQTAYDLARNFKLTPQMVEEWGGNMLIVYSDNDSTQKDHFEAQEIIYPNAKIHCFKGLGHTAVLNNPQEYARVVLGFLRD